MENSAGYNLPNEGFVTLKDLQKILPLSHATIYSMVNRGQFSKPISISNRRKAWPVRQVRNLLEKIEKGEINFGSSN